MEKNYNLELLRIISFVSVIVIHVTNYYCRAYGEISQVEYIFSMILDVLARVSVPCFYDYRCTPLGREEPLRKHLKIMALYNCARRVESDLYHLE